MTKDEVGKDASDGSEKAVSLQLSTQQASE
jgi:hypothetical protein